MEIFGFQLFFFFIILLSGIFGKKVRNFAVLVSLIFTVIMVFMTWLVILQFATIFIAYLVTENYVENSSKRLDKLDQSYGNGCLTLIVGGGILLLILKLCSDNYYKDSSNMTPEKKLTPIYENSNSSKEKSSYSIQDLDSTKFIDEKFIESNNSISHQDAIRNFIEAENERDLKKMFLYLSIKMNKFWEIKNPYPESIKISYYETWLKYDYTYTEVLNISEHYLSFYEVSVKYNYNNKSKINIIYFEFDENGKITSIY